MGVGPRTNLYRIGGDPLTQLKKINYIFWNFVFFIRNADGDKINGKSQKRKSQTNSISDHTLYYNAHSAGTRLLSVALFASLPRTLEYKSLIPYR